MEQFCQMASDQIGCLQFTFDSPKLNPSGMMPVLDTQVWVGTQARQYGAPKEIMPNEVKLPIRIGKMQQVISYKFERKEISNKIPFNAKSAAPIKDKIQQISQEFVKGSETHPGI